MASFSEPPRPAVDNAPTRVQNRLSKSTMTTPAKRHGTVNQERSAKRRKTDYEEPQYSDREVTWEEQLRLPARFREAEGVWPARRILKERKTGLKKEYLVDWEPHPETGEVFRPTWQPLGSVGTELLSEWKRQRSPPSNPRPKFVRVQSEVAVSTQQQGVEQRSQSAKPASRRAQNRRVIQDSSSSQLLSELEHAINGSRTPTLVDSQASSVGASPSSDLFEIAETQEVQPVLNRTISVNIPLTTINKADYESIRGSQLSLHDPALGSSSPLEPEKTDSVPKSSGHGPAFAKPTLEDSRLAQVLASSSVEQTSSQPGQAQLLPSPQLLRKPPPIDGRYLKDAVPDSQASQGALRHDCGVSQQTEEHSRPSTADSQNSSPRRSARRAKPNSRIINSSNFTDSIFKSPATPQGSPGARLAFELFQKMTSPPMRQSLRSRTGTPARNGTSAAANNTVLSPLNERLRRTRSSQTPQKSVPIHTSQAATPSEAGRTSQPKKTKLRETEVNHDQPSSMETQSLLTDSNTANKANGGAAPSTPTASQANYDPVLGSSALPIQQSIEEEAPSTDEQTSGSKTSSSQQSVENERVIPQVDGYVMPTLPILGAEEYAIALPAEGKIQSTYVDTIKAKRKPILRFLARRDSVGSGNGSANRTIERNEMIELVQRLHDTVTHLDLGLPDFATQYSLPSQEHAAYANYAGSKFVFLGHLADELRTTACSVVIMVQSVTVLNLVADYLLMKHVKVNRHDRTEPTDSQMTESNTAEPVFELSCGGSDIQNEIKQHPAFMIAFDTSFDAQDAQIVALREKYITASGRLLPVVHLLVANSSEHVDRCIPKSTPSPTRLKLLLRATIQAQTHLGGAPSYVPDDSDEPAEGGVMTYSDVQRLIRKSPNRKLSLIASMIARAVVSGDFGASYSLNPMPELQLDELDLTPTKSSQVTSSGKRTQAASPTPVSRTGTPARKRQLDVEGLSSTLAKRQRLTPVPDRLGHDANELNSQIEHLQQKLKAVQTELLNERGRRESAEAALGLANQKALEWQTAHATLQRRYEKRTQKSHKSDETNKSLLKQIEVRQNRVERSAEEVRILKDEMTSLKKELRDTQDQCRQGEPALAEWERAHEEARNYAIKCNQLERSLESTKKDFEFTRQQYQDASTKAVELAGQVQQLESQVADLSKKASGEAVKLKSFNFASDIQRHMNKINQLEVEKKSRETLIKKMEEEIKLLRRTRTGVQTRGNSVQPPGSPGPSGIRSRGGSPAPGASVLSIPRIHDAVGGVRGSGLRYER